MALRGAAARLPRHGPGGDERFAFLSGLVDGTLDRREALSLWLREGRPERERFGVTVSGDRQWAWLDDPGGPHAWPLPA